MTAKTVRVTQAGDGFIFAGPDRKALPPAQAGDLVDVAGDWYVNSLLADGFVELPEQTQVTPVTTPQASDEPAPVSKPLTDLPGVSDEIADVLMGQGVTDAAGVAAMSDAALLAISGIGPKRLKQIRTALE